MPEPLNPHSSKPTKGDPHERQASIRLRRNLRRARDAEADYDTLLDLHAASLVGTYDVALITKDTDGKVHVMKHEKPTQHGAWTGIAVGAVVGVAVPALDHRRAAVGGVAGGVIGHVRQAACRAATPRSSASCWRRARRR